MHRIVIEPDGSTVFIYDDSMVELMEHGSPNISRASHVEPTDDGRWTADMHPSNGPLLGPFSTRGEALSTEVRWLLNNVLV